MPPSALAPTGLLCQLMTHPEKVRIPTVRPQFGWVVNDGMPGAVQAAYRIQVTSDPETFAGEKGDVWDSGKVSSSRSLHVRYGGVLLVSDTDYYWRVCIWNDRDEISPWSDPQHIRTGALSEEYTTVRYPLEQTEVQPVEVLEKAEGHYFVDFGKAAFGTVRLPFTCAEDGHNIDIHLGERLVSRHTVDRSPDGAIRYRKIALSLKKGCHLYTLEIPPDKRNTGSQAILMPTTVGEVMPFRYCEIVNAPSPVAPSTIRQIAVHYPFDENASSFESSDTVLNAVWDICKYSIKATTFCGVYVDGDRERIPYEGDAYINQLGHYSVDREYTLARYTHEYLIRYPTWPTEWQLHSVMMAWEDYMYTGELQSLETFYGDLCAKTLIDLARDDGLISTVSELCTTAFERRLHLHNPRYDFGHGLRDLVDWPPGSFTEEGQGERDGHEMLPVNTVVNAFHYRALVLMSRIASALGRADDRQRFADQAARVKATINRLLFDHERGVYVDGEGSHHASLHSNMFILAFDLVPEERRQRVVSFVKSRGMACSVYGAQFLLKALYLSDEDAFALDLMTARHDRSWWNMIQVGSTMTLEAWDWKYKNNLYWNHAWGAAPANIIPRFLMGVRPLEPGFCKILIQPRPGTIARAEMKLPTIQGTVTVRFENHPKESFVLEVEIPANMTARIDLPFPGGYDSNVVVDGKTLNGVATGKFVTIDCIGSGRHRLERRCR